MKPASKSASRKSTKCSPGEATTETFKQPDATPAASHSEPRKLRLTRLWKCRLNGIAANIVVAPVNGKPRVLVVDGFKAITEIGLDGLVGESHSANLTEKELITNLRAPSAARASVLSPRSRLGNNGSAFLTRT